jgi:hypothetical protein
VHIKINLDVPIEKDASEAAGFENPKRHMSNLTNGKGSVD